MMKKVLATLLALSMCLTVPAAASAESGEYLKENLTVANSSDGGTFDPFGGFINWGQTNLTNLLFEHLIICDFDYNIYYCLAKEIVQVDDLHWKVILNDNIYDTDGKQLTIDDVIWSYQNFMDTGNKGAAPKFEKWERIDDYSATMVLSEPFADGDFIKHFGNPPVLVQETYENHDMVTDPVGTGPYKLAEYTVNSRVVLEAKEDYWGKEAGLDNPFAAQNFRTLTYDIIQDASSRAIAVEMGNADTSDSMDIMDVENLVASGKVNAIELVQRTPVAFIMNASESSILSSLELRQAILYGLDNAAIADALSVPAQPVYGLQPLMVDAPESWLTGEGRDYYNYDADKAAELLEASGYNGETIHVMYVSSTANDGAAIMIMSQLSKLGINVELQQVDQTVAEDKKYDPTEWDIRFDLMGGGAYMSQTTKMFWSEDIKDHVEGGVNSSMVVDEELDKLYVALKNDGSEENIAAWDEYFNSKAYAYAICVYANQTVCASDLQSEVLSSNGGIIPNAFVLAE